MQLFTDGEMRRGTWMAWLLESLGGVISQPGGLREWHRDPEQTLGIEFCLDAAGQGAPEAFLNHLTAQEVPEQPRHHPFAPDDV